MFPTKTIYLFALLEMLTYLFRGITDPDALWGLNKCLMNLKVALPGEHVGAEHTADDVAQVRHVVNVW